MARKFSAAPRLSLLMKAIASCNALRTAPLVPSIPIRVAMMGASAAASLRACFARLRQQRFKPVEPPLRRVAGLEARRVGKLLRYRRMVNTDIAGGCAARPASMNRSTIERCSRTAKGRSPTLDDR
jgi:hypothetical protein